jgi:hypothetical protein
MRGESRKRLDQAVHGIALCSIKPAEIRDHVLAHTLTDPLGFNELKVDTL